MTRSRISMVVAAAALVLVGLLAVALFSPTEEKPAESTNAKEDVAKVEAPKATASVLGNPVAVPAPAVQAPVVPTPAPVAEKPAPVAPTIIDYKVRAGDMISKIASAYGVKKEDIYALNPGLDDKTAGKIRVGQILRVPTGPGALAEAEKAEQAKLAASYIAETTITAQPGDTAFQLAVEHYGKLSMYVEIMKANPTLPWKDRLQGGEKVLLPAMGIAPKGAKVEEPKKEEPKPTVARDTLIPARR